MTRGTTEELWADGAPLPAGYVPRSRIPEEEWREVTPTEPASSREPSPEVSDIPSERVEPGADGGYIPAIARCRAANPSGARQEFVEPRTPPRSEVAPPRTILATPDKRRPWVQRLGTRSEDDSPRPTHWSAQYDSTRAGFGEIIAGAVPPSFREWVRTGRSDRGDSGGVGTSTWQHTSASDTDAFPLWSPPSSRRSYQRPRSRSRRRRPGRVSSSPSSPSHRG